MTSFSSTFFPPPPPLPLRRRLNLQPRTSISTAAPFTSASLSLSDPFVLEIAEKLEDSLPQSPSLPLLQRLRDSSSQSLVSKPWPSQKQEPFRFTDTSFLKNSEINPALLSVSPPLSLPLPPPPSLTVLKGCGLGSLSGVSALPSGIFAVSLGDLAAPCEMILNLLYDRFVDGDLFFDLNGVGTPDVAVVHVPAGVRIKEGEPLWLRFCYGGGSEVGEGKMPVSNPRVLVLVEKGRSWRSWRSILG